jgi:hypothetical protein
MEQWGYHFIEQFSSQDYLFAGEPVAGGTR